MNLAATMSLDAAPFTSGLAQARSGLSGLAGGVGSILGPLAGLAGIGLSVAGVFAGLKNAFGMGGELIHLNLRSGESIANLEVLRQAFQDTGIGAESVAYSISIMQKSLAGTNEEGQPTNQMFQKLGLNIQALKGMSALAQFQAIGAAIAGIKNPAEQTAAAIAIFGRSGASMKQLFLDPGAFEKTKNSLHSLPEVLQKNAGAFHEVEVGFGHLKTNIEGAFVGIAAGLTPAIQPLLDSIDAVDFTKWGVQIGKVITVLAQAFKTGQLGDLLALSLKIGIGEAANFLFATLNGFTTGLGAAIGDPDMWKGFGKAILGILLELGAGLIHIFEKPLTILQAGMDYIVQQFTSGVNKAVNQHSVLATIAALSPAGAALIIAAQKIGPLQKPESYADLLNVRTKEGTFITNAGKDSQKLGTQFIKQGLDAIQDAAPGLKAAFMTGFEDMQDAINMSSAKTELSKLVDSLLAGAEFQ